MLGLGRRRLRRSRPHLRRWWQALGPGLITGAADDDPSGIGTYAQAGAQYGYATLWTTIVMLPMQVAVQYICAKIGLVCGRGLAAVLRDRYPRAVLYPAVLALVAANTINAGADIGAIAAAINLLVPIPAGLLVAPVALAILALQVFGSYRLIARLFKWLTLVLLAYVGAAVLARPDAAAVLVGSLIPSIRLDPAFLGILVALLGTTISPYLFFWQASEEVEEEISQGHADVAQRRGASLAELAGALWDTVVGMVFSEAVAYFIILATGATLFVAGQTTIGSAADAAQALRPLVGDGAYLLFAIGVVGAGVLAVPVLVDAAGFAVADTFGWPSGLELSPTRAPGFYAVIALATLVAIGLNYLGINPISALVLTAILNGLVAPPLLVLVMLISNDRATMGERTNGRWLNLVGWGTALAMGLAAIGLLVTSVAS
jgi:NRAMP (natural resistance-associated macrophage protein)-like metal ion transporter